MKPSEPTSAICTVCGSGEVDFLCTTPNGHSRTQDLSNFRCRSCGLVFVGDHFDDEELGEAYSTLDSTEYYAEIVEENRKKMAAAVANLRKIVDPAKAAIIDIGTGNGEFLNVLRDAGFRNVSGHEIPGETVATDAAEIYQDFDYKSIPDASFDVATLLDVVEHVRDPQYLFDQCYRILKPGGYVYFHTPVVTRTDRLMHGMTRVPVMNGPARIWQRGRTSIFHLRNYSRTSIGILLRRASFTVESFRVMNELSWPVSRYVRVFLVDRLRLPRAATPVLTPFFYPLLATDIFNSNKSIVIARKPQEAT